MIVRLRQCLTQMCGHNSDSCRTIASLQGDCYFLSMPHMEQINDFSVRLVFYLERHYLIKSLQAK